MHIIYNIDLAGHSRLIVKFSLQLDWSSWPVLTNGKHPCSNFVYG